MLTDYREFGEWFQVKLDGPFVQGQIARGHNTYPGYEMTVQKIEREQLFSLTCHPYAIDPKVDYSQEPTTLVEFRLEATPSGTLLHLTESGFSGIPSHRSLEAFRMNEGGWTEQMKNIERLSRKGRSSLAESAPAPVFAALGDKTRLSLVAKLCGGQPQSISQLAEGSNLTRQAITKHLRVLENAGLVRSIRSGRESQFAFEPAPMEEIKTYLDHVSEKWGQALARLNPSSKTEPTLLMSDFDRGSAP